MTLLALWTALLLGPTAQAGSGPWTLPAGAQNLYVGMAQSRFSTLQTATRVQDLGAVRGTTLHAIGTLGLREGLEAELALPWTRVVHTDTDRPLCSGAVWPRDLCAPSAGPGPFQATLKGRVLDEGALRPVTLSLSAVLRNGTPTADVRDRLTAIGDGQTDIGAFASVGRTGQLTTEGWYTASATLGYWYRTPLRDAAGGLDKVPANQIDYAVRALAAPTRAVGVGPVLAGFHRLGGVDLADLDPRDPNGFASLQAAQVKVGAELLVSGAADVSLSISALQAIWAENNPGDTRVLSVGVGWYAEPRPTP